MGKMLFHNRPVRADMGSVIVIVECDGVVVKFGWFQTCNFTFWRQVEMSWQLCIRGGVKAKVKVVTVHISCSLVNQLTGSYQLC